ncbi:acriflavin resistance protein B [Escherichia coli]|uniref:Acriflavin resistance protein B n=1 Tax=Escherichia coli TaxID=562 RepID=A0A2X1N1M1_ECOLX|nr:acriflavin resistance protein B [Escherichia coli]
MDKEGKGLIEATLDAVRMRLRPILMTRWRLSSALCRWLSVLVLVPARRTQ